MSDDDDVLLLFGKRLREARLEAGLSQASVARSVGTSQAYVSRLEAGLEHPRPETIERFAQIFHDLFTLFTPFSLRPTPVPMSDQPSKEDSDMAKRKLSADAPAEHHSMNRGRFPEWSGKISNPIQSISEYYAKQISIDLLPDGRPGGMLSIIRSDGVEFSVALDDDDLDELGRKAIQRAKLRSNATPR